MNDAHAALQSARETALVCLRSAEAPGLEVLWAHGPDAASFLHSQLTNDVEGLEQGQGNLQARVRRTGHLEHLASLHRLPNAQDRFAFLCLSQHAQGLHDALDSMLFSDDLTLTVDQEATWLFLQGPLAADLADALFGPLGFEPWDRLPEYAVRPIRRARRDLGLSIPDGSLAFRRSLTGDVGVVVRFPTAVDGLAEAVENVCAATASLLVSPEAFDHAWDALRIEAGIPRLGPDTAGKARLLPETGIEQQAVSYTKGCYLGQEVIARVRTYGSVPTLLRALVLDGASANVLATLPDEGAPLHLADDDRKIGSWASRAWSVSRQAPIALAYLKRKDRTPGTVHEVRLADGTSVSATVAVLPLYAAADHTARAAQLYDHAIRLFASGDTDRAIQHLEGCLQLNPRHADAYEAIGVILGKTGRFHEAIDVFRRLEEVVPDEPMVNTNLSLYFMKIGDKETAEDESGKATMKSMAKAAGREGEGERVDEDLRRAKAREATRKLEMFEKVLAFDPEDPIALFGSGSALHTLGRHDEAVGRLERAIGVDSQNSAIYPIHGKALEQLARMDEAIATYTAGVEVASRKGDLMPLREMEHRLLLLEAKRR